MWRRDGGQCTFVSDKGQRCEARSRLEFDHTDPVARGGQATVAGLRLRCRAHNQYEAERVFGTGFMQRKRAESRQRTESARAAAQSRAAAKQRAQASAAAESARHADVIPWLRQLGFRADEARRGAGSCGASPDAPLEERVRAALRHLAPAGVRRTASAASSPG